MTNFRRADLAAGGQGAPLVTIGDELLFTEYDACLNLGGFCNLSLKNASGRMAFDIAPCNIILNRLAREKKQKMDEGGQIAEQGSIIYPLLEALNSVPYYSKKAPKSLGREWINKEFWHIVRDYDDHSVEDRMKTLVMHIATQIALALDTYADKAPEDMKILVTGGGTMNPTLVDFIKTETDSDIVVPDDDMINYKEAMIFALLGVMRVRNLTNVMGESTGADYSVIGGSLDGDFSNLI